MLQKEGDNQHEHSGLAITLGEQGLNILPLGPVL